MRPPSGRTRSRAISRTTPCRSSSGPEVGLHQILPPADTRLGSVRDPDDVGRGRPDQPQELGVGADDRAGVVHDDVAARRRLEEVRLGGTGSGGCWDTQELADRGHDVARVRRGAVRARRVSSTTRRDPATCSLTNSPADIGAIASSRTWRTRVGRVTCSRSARLSPRKVTRGELGRDLGPRPAERVLQLVPGSVVVGAGHDPGQRRLPAEVVAVHHLEEVVDVRGSRSRRGSPPSSR